MIHNSIFRAVLCVAFCFFCGAGASSSSQNLVGQPDIPQELNDADSDRAAFDATIASAESQYGRSDSTVDLVFYDEGIERRVYFASFGQADSVYSRLLASAEESFGKDDLNVSTVLLRLAEARWIQGLFYDAEEMLKRALGIRETLLGDDDLLVAEVQHSLAVVYTALAYFPQADSLGRHALSIRERLRGPDHPEVMWSLLAIARADVGSKDFLEAERLAFRAVAIAEKVFAPDGLEMAACLEVQGDVLYYLDDEGKAEELYLKVRSIRERILGTGHPEVADAMFRIANAVRFLKRFDEAEALFDSVLAIRQAVYGWWHPSVALTRLDTGRMYNTQLINIEKGEAAYADALAIYERIYQPDHAKISEVARLLGMALANNGRHSEAMPYLQRSVEILERDPGSNPRELAAARSSLAFNYYRVGRFAESEARYIKVINSLERSGDGGSRVLANALTELGLVLNDLGRYDEAIEKYRRSLAIVEGLLPSDHPDIGIILLNLSIPLMITKRCEEAEALLDRAIDLLDKAFNLRHPNVAIALIDLGDVYECLGRYEEADSVLRLSVEVGEEMLGPQNPGFAHALNNLTNLDVHMGRYEEAESLQVRAVGILEGALGPEHPQVAKFRRDLGRLLAYSGKVEQSLASYERFIDWSQRFIENVFPYSSEEQKLLWVSTYPMIDETLLSLAASSRSKHATSVAAEMVLKSKAMVIEAVMAERRAAYCVYDDAMEEMLGDLNTVCTQIANLSLAGGAYIDSLRSLYALKDSLEVQLSLHCREFSEELTAKRFEVSDVVKALPTGSTLLEYIRYTPVDLSPDVLGDAKIGQPHYLAFNLNHSGDIRVMDLGPANEIDSLILLARSLIYKAEGQIYTPAAILAEERLKAVTRELSLRVFEPLLDGHDDIYVCPDGMLNLIPFEILPLEDSLYVIERYRLSYLSSGRDLLRYKDLRTEGKVLVFADPDFDGAGTLPLSDTSEVYGPQLRGITDCMTRRFARLSHTREEAQSVVERFSAYAGGLDQYFGADATEERLKSIEEAPRVLHLATHGFFCESAATMKSTIRDNPLLRSGLAFSGANRALSGESSSEDGILTALEVSGLNLVGTELAVLSACESGVGELVSGEGVFGLRRAFQHAGVQTVLMSLWSVPDRETSQLMEGFYDRWLEGMSKRDALRASSLEMLESARSRRGCGHPLLWGGFIITGNPN